MRTPLNAAVAFSILLSVAGCTCNGPLIQERLGPRPAQRLPIDDYLQETLNPPLSRFSRAVGFFTTPFQNVGVVGWVDFHAAAQVLGCRVTGPISNERLQTVGCRA